ERALWALYPAREGDSVTRERGADLLDHARRGDGAAGGAEAAAGARHAEGAAARAGAKHLVRASSRGQGRPIWSVRHRRRDECEPPRRRLGRVAGPRAGAGAARRASREGAPQEEGTGASHLGNQASRPTCQPSTTKNVMIGDGIRPIRAALLLHTTLR